MYQNRTRGTAVPRLGFMCTNKYRIVWVLGIIPEEVVLTMEFLGLGLRYCILHKIPNSLVQLLLLLPLLLLK
ncbi:hypothetical protein DL95DRAFT_65976 [Leptodontidium sp. 2 PMI_412]|nr:hypothetical protein DL95DRAFT_65976 [Leptodontidium sp. 2 PMI_412]